MESRKNNTPSQIFETPEASGFDRVGEDSVEDKIQEQQFMTRRNSELIVVSGEPMLAYDGLKLDEQVKANMLVAYEAAIAATHQKYQDYADEHELDDVRVAVEVLRKQHD